RPEVGFEVHTLHDRVVESIFLKENSLIGVPMPSKSGDWIYLQDKINNWNNARKVLLKNVYKKKLH
ncbi:hypothetical protein AKJ65_08260, partial [candidate division MSBL1 archaeon SCGC-AAA259E19]